MREWRVKKRAFARYLLLRFSFVLLQIAHGLKPVGYHYQDYPHIFRHRKQQFSKVFGFERHVFPIQLIYALQPADDMFDFYVELLLYFLRVNQFVFGWLNKK